MALIFHLNNLEKKALENILEKGENVGNQHFLLFAQCFLQFQKKIHCFIDICFVVCKCFQFGSV